MRIKFFLFFVFVFVGLELEAKNVHIKVLYQYNPKKIILNAFSDNYSIALADDKIIKTNEGDVIVINAIGNSCTISKNAELIGTYHTIRLSSLASHPYFKLQMILPSMKTTFYPDNMLFSSNDSKLQIINEVELNHYVAGVIESEIGNVKNDELLKVQAVISRTYALKHIDRHKVEGFELCDQVHCQVYHGKARFNTMILPAVDSTHYEIIHDENGELIEAVFHANCGGQTVNSEDVWSKKRPYLRSVVDTFCTTEKQARWVKEIDKQKWLNFISAKSGKSTTDPCEFSNDFRLIKIPCVDVFTEDARDEFRLRSTFFNIRDAQNKVILNGRGFGHGVGMCQEGSIRQAKLGTNYKSIIMFYYTHVQIVNMEN